MHPIPISRGVVYAAATMNNTTNKMLRVSYSWTNVCNDLTFAQFLGNGQIDENGAHSDCARAVLALRVGQSHEHKSAFGCVTTYKRVS